MSIPYIFAKRNLTEKPDLNMFKMHTHDDYEIYCFLRGSAKYYIEGNIYKLNSGDILLMKCAEAHSLIVSKNLPYERIIINFNKEALVGGLATEIIDFLNNRSLGKENKYPSLTVQNILPYLNAICERKDLDERRLYLTFALNEIKKLSPSENDAVIDSIQSIVEYINTNLFSDITLDSVAERFFMSRDYINRKFKKCTGSTIWAYIVTKRLIYAKKLLLNGEKPTAVYQKCGFNDYSSFYKAYKQKYGVSPNREIN